MNETPETVNTPPSNWRRPCPTIAEREAGPWRAQFGIPKLDARGRLCVGYLCPDKFRWWLRGGAAVRAALELIEAPASAFERYEHVFDLEAAAAERAMDLLDHEGKHLPDYVPPPQESGPKLSQHSPENWNISNSEIPKSKRTTRREQRAEVEIDLFAETF